MALPLLALVAAATVGPEFSPLTYQSAPRTLAGGSATAMGLAPGRVLIAWLEAVDGRYSLFVARSDLQGNVLDPDSIVLARGLPLGVSISGVVWNGSHWLVVWSVANAPSGQARRVALDGSLPDPGDIALGLNASSVATDGSGWMVSGADLTGTTFVTRLDGSGAIALPATTVFGSGFEHRLGHDGSTWVMAYERGNQVFVTRLTAAGVSLDGNGVRLDSTALAHDEPVMACRVGECLVG